MRMDILLYVLFVQVSISYQQNISPEHRKRHCQALQTSEIIEHALPEIQRFIHDESENIQRLQSSYIVDRALPKLRRIIREEIKSTPENSQEVSSQRGSIILRCEEGWVYYDGHCYLFSKTKKTWQEAKSECQNMNSYLVEIRSYDENNFIKEEVMRLNTDKSKLVNYYIGASLHSKGWTWSRTGELFGYTDWAPGEPNNSKGEEQCVEIKNGLSGVWNDVKCSKSFLYICKTRVQHEVHP